MTTERFRDRRNGSCSQLICFQRNYQKDANFSLFLSHRLKSAIERYDKVMGFANAKPAKKWDMWGGLYYAGTIYTTIGERSPG